jgi:hypothetical protein
MISDDGVAGMPRKDADARNPGIAAGTNVIYNFAKGMDICGEEISRFTLYIPTLPIELHLLSLISNTPLHYSEAPCGGGVGYADRLTCSRTLTLLQPL